MKNIILKTQDGSTNLGPNLHLELELTLVHHLLVFIFMAHLELRAIAPIITMNYYNLLVSI